MAFFDSLVKMEKSGKFMNDSESNFQKNDEVTNQIQLLLFKESGLKGRALIFDSSMIESMSQNCSNKIVNSSVNVHKLTDLVFGSLTLRCHETYFRIHNLSSPNRIMFTQVFPIPYSKKLKHCSLHSNISCNTITNLDVFYLDPKVSNTSLGDSSVSLEMENADTDNQYNTRNSSTSTIDSGYTDQSFSSFVISNRNSFGSGALLSQNHNKMQNIETRSSLVDSNFSSNNNLLKELPIKTSSTFGLVIILTTTAEDKYPKNYMKHIAFIESIVFRIRRNIELSFNKPSVLLSLMVELTHESTEWLLRIFPISQKCNSCDCDVNNKYKRYHGEKSDDPFKLNRNSLIFKINNSKLSFLRDKIFPNKLLSHCKSPTIVSNGEPQIYFNEFCEILEKLESKETNFFISSITTAILTYHLGWISTCYPNSNYNKDFRPSSNSFNSLWRQMSELYGANGSPTKSVQTIINGSNKNEIILKVLSFIHYFVRYSKVMCSNLERINANIDNKAADNICQNDNNTESHSLSYEQQILQKKSTLCKSKARFSNLSELVNEEDQFDKNYATHKRKVTFLLGENEELVNIKPNLIPKKNITSLESNDPHITTTVLNSANQLGHNLRHSTFSLNLDQLDKYRNPSCTRIDDRVNKHSTLEPPTITNEYHRPTFYNQIRSSGSNYFGERNEQFLNPSIKQTDFHKITKMKIFYFPLPKSKLNDVFQTSYASTLKSETVGKYVPDMVIQGTNILQKECISKLKTDLYLTRQIYFFEGYVDESVAVVGNTDTWDVEVISSRVSMNQKTIGMKMDISSLVSNMLEVLLEMWNLHFCKKYSTTHIEQRLLEICIRSYAFSELLLHTDMCTMDLLTTTLHFEINDIPLLMSVASVIAPQVTKKYGLSFQ